MVTTRKIVCSVFGGEKGSKMHTVYLEQIIYEKYRNVDYYALLLKQAQTRPTVAPNRKDGLGIFALKIHVIWCNVF